MRTSKLAPTLSLLSCFAASSAAHALNVFGDDDRVVQRIDVSPYNRIVNVNYCTGSLVGKNLVLTAAHCLKGHFKADEAGKPVLDGYLSVSLGLDGYQVRRWARALEIRMGTTEIAHPSANDWAVIAVDENLADSADDYFEIVPQLTPQSPENHGVLTAGYNGDLESGRRVTGPSRPCGITNYRFTGEIYFDCDIAPGASGSPIWKCDDQGVCRIVGIVVGELRGGANESVRASEYSIDRANIGVPPQRFYGAVQELKLKYPEGAPPKPVETPTTAPAPRGPSGPFRSPRIYPTPD